MKCPSVRLLVLGVGMALGAGVAAAADIRTPGGRVEPWPFRLDCTAGAPRCLAFVPEGDAEHELPGYGPSPFRGFADPTIRQDPVTGRLWMAYSWPNVEAAEPAIPGQPWSLYGTVDIHLAHSDDLGSTWAFDGALWQHQDEIDPGGSGSAGFSGFEVATLAWHEQDDAVTWFGARARYHVPESGGFLDRRGDSFHLVISQAGSPPELATAPAARLGSALTAPGWQVDTNLSWLDPEVADCGIWNEPALHVEDDTLYLAAVCLVFDLSTGERRPLEEKVVLFATEPEGEVESWTWRYVGVLAGSQEAAELGAETLTQIDLARSRDGALLALVSPNDWSVPLQADIHHGLRVLEVESLDPPGLVREPSGALRVRASIRATDLPLYGPAASGYDPASETGIVFVRRVFDTQAETMVWSLHRTEIHP